MKNITHGEVTFGQTNNLGDYNSKKAEVKIGFNVDEGDDAAKQLDAAGQMAKAKCAELLGNTPAAAKIAAPAAPAVPAGPTKADLAAAAKIASPETAAPKPRAKKPPAPKPAEDPSAMSDETVIEEPAAEDASDLFSAEEPDAPAAKITDEELTTSITKRNAVINNPPVIRQLISKYVKMPGQARDIPQEKRQEFLTELAALPAPAKA